MKKLVSMYQKYMFRPILYKSVTRVSVVAVLMLLWDRYVSDGTFTMWQAPALLLGVVRWLGFNIPMLYILNAVVGMNGLVWSQVTADSLNVVFSLIIFLRFRPPILRRESLPEQ